MGAGRPSHREGSMRCLQLLTLTILALSSTVTAKEQHAAAAQAVVVGGPAYLSPPSNQPGGGDAGDGSGASFRLISSTSNNPVNAATSQGPTTVRYVTVLQPVGTAVLPGSNSGGMSEGDSTADVFVLAPAAQGGPMQQQQQPWQQQQQQPWRQQQQPWQQQRPMWQQPRMQPQRPSVQQQVQQQQQEVQQLQQQQMQQGGMSTIPTTPLGTVSEAGPRSQQATAGMSAMGQWGSGSSGARVTVVADNDDSMMPDGQVGGSSSSGDSTQQLQQPSVGRGQQKFPFAQCANTTLMYDVSFIGSVQYAQVGSVRFAYHKFGPLGDAATAGALSAPSGLSMVFKSKLSPVVFISGWGLSMYMWPVPLLKALAANRPVVIFDTQRTGGSSDSSRAKLTIPLMADSTAGLIAKLQLDKPDIWSWSLGASIGYALLAKHANKLGNVILASGTPGGPNALLPPANVWKQARAVEQNYNALLPFLFPDGAKDTGVCAWYASYNSFSAAGLNISSPLGKKSINEQGEALMAFFSDASVISKLKDVTNRVLIMHGVQDRLMPVRNAVLGAQQLLGSWMLQFPEEGHAVPFDNLPAVIAMTEEFFTFANPLSASTLRTWANYGQTFQQQSKAAAAGRRH